ALLLNDEGVVFAGLLVGLSSIDFCFALKDNLGELDYPVCFECAQVRQIADEECTAVLIVELEVLKLVSVDAGKASLDRVLAQLRLQLSDLQTRCSQQQNASKIQQELLCSLQLPLKERTTERVSQLQEEVEHWRNLYQERESSCFEMAAVVSSSKLEADSLRVSHSALQNAQWTADSLLPNCSQCHIAFSVNRRRNKVLGLKPRLFCHVSILDVPIS
ncbi:hypothetical protein EG68_05075, partial [Paragonimus skrjabini miyazakii]